MVEALARPPTPPRTSCMLPNDEKDRTGEDSPVILQTPGASPFSTNGSAGHPSTRHSKRVNFSPWTRYIKPPSFSSTPLNSKPDLKALPPSNECKPSKSILKATNINAPVNTVNDDPLTPESFIMLLESIAQQLAGESATTRLDAYMHFFGVLRTYEGVPDQQEISGKLGLITQFIQRDVTRNLENGGPVDINLVCQALKLSAALSWHIETSPQLSDDFKIFLVDHSINCLQDAKVPKSVLMHCMSILSTQEFGPRIMSNARLIRLLTTLHTITDRVNGNAIVSQRLSIYQRVLSQSKSTFISQSTLWMEHLISGLLHTFKDTRIKAITLGFQTSMVAGPNPTLSKAIREIFDRSLDSDRKLVNEISERMSRMMASSDSGIHVPQIWSVIILLIRTKKLNIDHWGHFKEWVLILQRCFNCSDPAIKAQAIMGWNRFVFVVSPNETTSLSMMKMLSKPILSQFERKKQEKIGTQPSQLALSSYYNLLYYSFHPSASFQFLDSVWKEYVASPSSSIFSTNLALSDRVSQALSSMLWSSHAKVWTEAKVGESSKLDPADLPTLDCRWTRSRVASVLGVFEDLLRSSVWADDALDQSNIAVAWVSLSNALSYASSKEITPTPESMHAVASVLGLLQRLWNTGASSLNAVGDNSMDKFFDRFRFLSSTIIISLGSIPFTEKLLLKTADATFQAATPTHRDQRGNSNLDAPILHFLRLISDVSGISEPTPSYLHLINGTLEAACNGKISRSSRLELLRQCADLYPSETEFHFGVHNFAQIAWKSTAQLAADTLCSFPMESARERDETVSRDYENIVKILLAGLKFFNVSEPWNQLLDSSVRAVKTERGDRAIATMVLEPLAEHVTQLKVRETYLPSTSLLKHALSVSYHYPDASRKSGKEVKNGVQPVGANELFLPEKLLALVHKTLLESYAAFDPTNSKGIAGLIESVTSFLGSGVLTFRSMVLEKLQEPLAPWLRDGKRQLNVESGVDSRILTACRALSSAVLNVLQVSISDDASYPRKFESILCAGLESSHMSVAKRFVDMLTALSEPGGSLNLSECISQALQKPEPKSQPNDSPLSDSLQARHHPDAVEDNNDPTSMQERPRQTSSPLETSRSVGLDSSPVVKTDENVTAPTEGQNQATLQEPTEDENADRYSFVPESVSLPTDSLAHNNRDEMFSMIEGLRSSSPINMPQRLEFRTPPKLRNLPRGIQNGEPPLTPTLAAVSAENDDIFLGSSPTPSTRTKPQAAASRPSSQRGQGNNVHTNGDPPSSPPELKSPSPNAHQEMEASAQDNTENDKMDSLEPQDEQSENDLANTITMEEPKPRRQTRSASKKSTPKTTPSKGVALSSTPQKAQNEAAHARNGKSNSRAKASASRTPSKSKCSLPKEDDEEPVTNDVSDHVADPFNDDIESQIATQLEQDLEFAVDRNDKSDAGMEEQTEPPPNPTSPKKRKREVEEVQTPPRKETRRSTRLSSSQQVMDTPSAMDMTPEPGSTRSKKSRASEPSAKKRKSQPKVNDPEPMEPPAEETQLVSQIDESQQPADDNTERSLEIPGSSQKRRRSSRIGGLTAPATPEENQSPSQKKSPWPSRSRKQGNNPEISQEASQEAIQTEERAPDSQLQEKPDAEVDIETAVQDNVNEPDAPEEQVEAQKTLGADLLLQAVEIQQGIRMEQLDEHIEQAPAEADIEMGDAGVAPESKAESHPEPEHEPEPVLELISEPESEFNAEDQTTFQAPQTEQAANAPGTQQAELIHTFEQTLHNLKSATLDENSFRELDELLFKIRVEAHDAFRRHTTTITSTSLTS